MVCRAGGSFGKSFATFWGITQGWPLSSLMFNVCVDAVIREWLCRTINEKAASGVFSEACREIVAFFVDNGLVRSRDPIWLQSAMDILITLFEGIGLRTNPDKTKVMTCIPGNIQVAHMEAVYHVQQQGPVNPTTKPYWVECDVCGVSLVAGSLQSHLETQHDTYRLFVLNRELTVELEPRVYQAIADATGAYFCPVLACVGIACSEAVLQSHFLSLSSLSPPGFGVLPNRRVPSLAALQQMWTADHVRGHERPSLQDCPVQGWGSKEGTTCGS
jgi:hypothetical protein